MDIPEFRRGLELTSRELNRLSNAIRAASITSVIGGTFSRTPGGTALIIDQQVRGGGSGATPCQYFEVTDASEGTTLKVEVAQGLIAGRWPDGMGLNFPPFLLTISGNSYIYAKATYNTTTLQLLPDSDAITILQASEVQQNTEDSVYMLLATVVTGGSPKKITKITNVCSEPIPNPCNLAWTS